MPLVVLAVIVSLTGHAVGAAASGWALALAACAGACALARVRALGLLVALLVLGLAGAGRASAARWRDAACTTAMLERARTDSLIVVPDVDAAAGDRVPGRARLPWCALAVGIRARGALVGGTAYRVALAPRMGTRRPIVELRGTPAPDARTSVLARWRAAAARRISARFGPDAPLVNALVVADVHELDDAIRTRWARAGIVHALSVSGLHVGIVAGVLALVAQAAGAAPGRAAALSFVGVGAYVLVIGACAPAVRSAVMFGAVAAARARQRPVSPWAALALGAWIPVLVDPAVPLDLGWQLSVGGIAALEGAGRLCRTLGLEGSG
ncbi:MAG: ComEC/Rec2 family competence protein, partial [Gemmatimonadaceae bacterium]|nr:ComEC/Rec2 family competence protein [Gemmatimonadaceae bacterium]